MEVEKNFEAGIGWAFAKACALLDEGKDPRQFDMANLLPEAEADFKRPPETE